MKVEEYNGLALAYIGDAYYELKIREYLVNKGYLIVNDLHKMAIKYTSGNSQAKFMDYFINNNLLTEEEISCYKKGRNANSNGRRKNISLGTYMKATGFEAMIGFLYLKGNLERIKKLLDAIYEFAKEE